MNDPGSEELVKSFVIKGGYLVPTTFTLANLLVGLYSILHSFRGHFFWAGLTILIALVLDGLDGRLARWTGNVSEFGVQLDSLADLVSFGLAPAFLAYNAWLSGIHYQLGFLVAGLFVCGAAMRLARFNAHDRRGERLPYFNGLPTPAAAGAVVGLWYLEYKLLRVVGLVTGEFTLTYFYLAPFLIVLLSYLMLSSHRYPSFKNPEWIRSHPWLSGTIGIPAIVLVLVGEWYFYGPTNASLVGLIITVIFLGYLLFGFIPGSWKWGLEDPPED